MSILDGWWDESYNGANGWAIDSADDDPDLERRDLREAGSLFAILENQVVRNFYDRGRDGVPSQWVEMVLEAWATLGPQVTASRMVRDYTTALYEPAAASSVAPPVRRRQGGRGAGRRGGERVDEAWDAVVITSVDVDGAAAAAGAVRGVEVTVELGGLTPADVRVEVVHGSLGHDGEFLPDVNMAELQPTGDGDLHRGHHGRRRRLLRRVGARHPRAPRPRQPVRRRPHGLGRVALGIPEHVVARA